MRRMMDRRNNVIYNLTFKPSKYIVVGISLTILILVVLFSIIRVRVIAFESHYRFFPRADLGGIYNDYIINGAKEISNMEDALDYYQFMRKSTIIGTAYQYRDAEFTLGFDMYEPMFKSDKLEALLDTGRIIFDSDIPDRPEMLFFDICAFKYNEADLFGKQLIIQNDSRQEGFVLGYLLTVYVSPTGKIQSLRIPLDGSTVTVDTKKESSFLKEICVFSAYKREIYVLQDKVLYQVKEDGNTIGNFELYRDVISEQ